MGPPPERGAAGRGSPKRAATLTDDGEDVAPDQQSTVIGDLDLRLDGARPEDLAGTVNIRRGSSTGLPLIPLETQRDASYEGPHLDVPSGSVPGLGARGLDDAEPGGATELANPLPQALEPLQRAPPLGPVPQLRAAATVHRLPAPTTAPGRPALMPASRLQPGRTDPVLEARTELAVERPHLDADPTPFLGDDPASTSERSAEFAATTDPERRALPGVGTVDEETLSARGGGGRGGLSGPLAWTLWVLMVGASVGFGFLGLRWLLQRSLP